MSDTDPRPFKRLLDFCRSENSPLVFGLGCLGDVLIICQGGLDKNWLFAYAGIAGVVSTGLMTIPGLLKPKIGEARSKQLEETMKKFVGPLHHSGGIAMMGSGFGLAGTAPNLAEKAYGLCSTSGSLMQFWGDRIMHATGMNKVPPFDRLDAGKLAAGLYSISTTAVLFDAMRLHAPMLYVAFGCYGLTLGLLAVKGREEHGLQDALPKSRPEPAGNPPYQP